MCKEINRVLKKTGVFIEITYGNFEFRAPYFEKLKNWTIETETFGND
jgi:hypothetical protein